MRTITDLLPCPFCGCDLVPYAETFPEGHTERHSADDLNRCGAMSCPTKGCPSSFSVILTAEADEAAAWNTRNPPSSEAGWQPDMAAMPWAVTLLFKDPTDADGMDVVRLGLRDEAGAAIAWAWLPGEGSNSTALPTIKEPTGKPFDFEAAKHGYVPPSISLRREPTDGK